MIYGAYYMRNIYDVDEKKNIKSIVPATAVYCNRLI